MAETITPFTNPDRSQANWLRPGDIVRIFTGSRLYSVQALGGPGYSMARLENIHTGKTCTAHTKHCEITQKIETL